MLLPELACQDLGGDWNPERHDCSPNPCPSDQSAFGDGDASVTQLIAIQPNPSLSAAYIILTLSPQSRASLRIHDATGRLVRTLNLAHLPPGRHAIGWDGRSERGASVGAGVYFCTLRATGVHDVLKLFICR
jgi:hypothetical protein